MKKTLAFNLLKVTSTLGSAFLFFNGTLIQAQSMKNFSAKTEIPTVTSKSQTSYVAVRNSTSTPPISILGGGPLCTNDAVKLTAEGGTLGTDAVYEWFKGACSGTPVYSSTEPTYMVPANEAGIYFVKTSDDSTAANCVSTTITRNLRIAKKGSWEKATTWIPASIPTSENCVQIPEDVTVTLLAADANAKSLNVEGTLYIYSNLTVEDEIITGENSDLTLFNDGALVQKNDAAVNSGNINVERDFWFSKDRKEYNFVISPVIGQALKTIYPGSQYVIYHKESKNFFYNAGNGNYDLNNPAKGFSMKEAATGENHIQANFRGIPFNGKADFTLGYTTNNPDPTYTPGYNLMGNPYPSGLDIDSLYHDNENLIEPTFEFWDNRGNSIWKQMGSGYDGNSYAIYNAVSGQGTPAGIPEGMDAKEPTDIVTVGTAFMIRALPDANGKILSITNKYRSIDTTGPTFYGKESGKRKNRDRFWLGLVTPKNLQLTTGITYFEKGKKEIGKEDSESSYSSDDMFSVVENKGFAIQGRPQFDKKDILDLGLNTFEHGTYKIILAKAQGVFANGQDIFLKDNKTGIITNLSKGHYEFTSDKGQDLNRFQVLYAPENTTLSVTDSALSDLVVYPEDQIFVIRSTTRNVEETEVYDLSGRLLLKTTTKGKEVRISKQALGKGIFILKIRRGNEILSKKIRN